MSQSTSLSVFPFCPLLGKQHATISTRLFKYLSFFRFKFAELDFTEYPTLHLWRYTTTRLWVLIFPPAQILTTSCDLLISLLVLVRLVGRSVGRLVGEMCNVMSRVEQTNLSSTFIDKNSLLFSQVFKYGKIGGQRYVQEDHHFYTN